jgi:(p)ppGpp synthase/HD superfamily hydrolase
MANLARAIEIAASAHIAQTRRDGSPYVLHPLRLMFTVSGELEMTAAVMHDVVEDTDWTLEMLRAEGFPEELLTALDLLTHKDSDSYDAYVRKLAEHPIARTVKLADLEDNMNLLQCPTISERDLKRTEKYHRYWTLLKGLEAEHG